MSDSGLLNRKTFGGEERPDVGNAKEPRQKIRAIGVLCHDGSEMGLRHYLFAEIIERFKSMVERHGYDIFFLSNQIGKTGLSYYDHLCMRKADGVFLLNVGRMDKEQTERLKSIPRIAVDYCDESTGCVMTDCDKSMALLYNYLYGLGHRNIVYLHGEAGYLTDARIRGLRSAMEARGETLRPDSLVQSRYYSIDAGYASMKQALSRKERPTAVIASDDYSAVGAMSAARDIGLSVPGDVSVAGFDGYELTQFTAPRLTTIRQDTLGLGAKAAENLIKQILGVGERGKSESILLEPKLIIGESCRRID